jgi:hypothetical protein
VDENSAERDSQLINLGHLLILEPLHLLQRVTQVPTFRITPDYLAKKNDTDSWQDGRTCQMTGAGTGTAS